MIENKTTACEACGSPRDVHVRATSGGLFLCGQCLGDINRKNPVVCAAEVEIARLRSMGLALLEEWFELERQYQWRDRYSPELLAEYEKRKAAWNAGS